MAIAMTALALGVGPPAGALHDLPYNLGHQDLRSPNFVLRAPDEDTDHFFGEEVVIDGGLVAVAAALSEPGQQAGIYLFERREDNSWQFVQKLAPFWMGPWVPGRALDLDAKNGILVVGSYDDWNDGQHGVVHVFEQAPDGHWFRTARLTSPHPATSLTFGQALAVDGNRLLVGDPNDNTVGLRAGAAHLFRRTPTGDWNLETSFYGTYPWNLLASSVALGPGRIVLGTQWDSPQGPMSGSATVYEERAPGSWVLVAKLEASDGVAGARLGESAALDEDLLILGAPGAVDASGLVTGAAYVFRRASTGEWEFEAKLQAVDAEEYEWFGYDVAVDGTWAVAGAPIDDAELPDTGAFGGSAHLFERLEDGTWQYVAKLNARDGAADHLGYSVSISARTIVAGDIGYDDFPGSMSSRNNMGAAYIFEPQPPRAILRP